MSNGKLSPNLISRDSKVTVLCEEGYFLLGAPNLTCIDGNWSDYSPICLKGKYSLNFSYYEIEFVLFLAVLEYKYLS